MIGCYANSDSDVPVDPLVVTDATNVADRFSLAMKLGAAVHALGICGDSSFAVRVWVKNTQWYRIASLILVSVYSLLWLVWLIWIHVLVFGHDGSVCKGSYLSDTEYDAFKTLPNYALMQGRVMTNTIIGIWVANGTIFLLSVIASIVGSRYLKSK